MNMFSFFQNLLALNPNIKHQIKVNRGHERRNQEKGCCVSFFCKYNKIIILDP